MFCKFGSLDPDFVIQVGAVERRFEYGRALYAQVLQNVTLHLGGGGGGSGGTSDSASTGGDGGDGVVIIRYRVRRKGFILEFY